jgi:hypothetical protein
MPPLLQISGSVPDRTRHNIDKPSLKLPQCIHSSETINLKKNNQIHHITRHTSISLYISIYKLKENFDKHFHQWEPFPENLSHQVHKGINQPHTENTNFKFPYSSEFYSLYCNLHFRETKFNMCVHTYTDIPIISTHNCRD